MLEKRLTAAPKLKVTLCYESPFVERPASAQRLRVLTNFQTGTPTGFFCSYKFYNVSFTPSTGIVVTRAPSGYSETVRAEDAYFHEPGGTVIPVALFKREVLTAAKKDPKVAALVRENSHYFK